MALYEMGEIDVAYQDIKAGLTHDQDNEQLQGLEKLLKAEILKEYSIVPKDAPIRDLWQALDLTMARLGARVRVTIDFVTERNRGLKSTIDLSPGEQIMVLPYKCMIKQAHMQKDEWVL